MFVLRVQPVVKLSDQDWRVLKSGLPVSGSAGSSMGLLGQQPVDNGSRFALESNKQALPHPLRL